MTVFIALGIGAGLVSGLLFAAAGTGSIPAVLLMYIAPLPMLIVALGWHHLLGLLALSAGAILTTVLMRPEAGVAFAVGPGLCAWVLAYAAAMRVPSRAAAPGPDRAPAGPGAWFPVGWLLFLVGIAGALIALCSLVAATGGSFDSYQDALRQAFSALLRREMRGGRPAPGTGFPGSEFIGIVVAIAPALLASMLTLIFAVNLWFAGRIVLISGRLPRPWPDIPSGRMPRLALAAGLAGLLASQLPGFVGVAGTALAGGTLMAFALQGLALLHFATRNRPGRGLMLSVAYFLTIVLGYVFLPAFALLGIADSALPLRQVLGRRGPPPKPPTFKPPTP